MPSRTYPLLAVVLAFGLVFASCGGDDDDNGEALSEEEFVATVNGACERAGEEVAEEAEFEGIPEPEELAVAVESLGSIMGELVSDLEAVNPPEEHEEDYESLVDGFREATDLLDQQAEVAREDPDALLDPEGEFADPESDFNVEAQRLGSEVDELSEELGVPECTSPVEN